MPAKFTAKLLVLLILACMLISLPIAYAYAEERSFEISKVQIHARIDSDGNMHVTELDTYRFEGVFNGILVDLNSAGSDGIENFQAYEVAGRQDRPLQVEASVSGTRHEYRVYSRSENETKVFKITYTVRNVIQVYTDIAQLYWKFFDETNSSPMQAVVIDIELPGRAAPEEIWAFGHGTVGSIQRLDNGVIRFEVAPFPSGQFLETRVLFSPKLVPGSTRVRSEPMLEKILAEEEKWASGSADEGIGSIIGGLVMLIGNLLAGYYLVYKKYNKKFRPEFRGEYYRDLPGDVTPAVVSYLMNFRIEPRDLMATMMDLVRKKYVTMDIVPGKKNKEDYIFRLNRSNKGRLLPHEQTFIKWFFYEIGRKGKIALSDIKTYAKKDAESFLDQWKSWQQEIIDAAKNLGLIQVREKTVYTWVLLAVFLQIFAIFSFLPESWYWTFMFPLPLLFFKPKRRRRTQAGQTEYSKWKAFRNFLQDYSRIESREPLAIHLWEHYFVYTIPLGVAKKMNSISRIAIPSEDRDAVLGHTFWHMIFHYDDWASDWTSSIQNTITKGRLTESAGSFIGSFTSGGGGGGGGGGGRGAF